MQRFENLDGKSFRLNSTKNIKNFIVMPIGSEKVAIYNAFDTKLQLLPATHYSEIKVNDASFPNQTALIDVLAPMLFSKVVYSEGIQPNGIIYMPEIIRNENLLTIPAGGVWRLDGIVIGNTTQFQTTIDFAQDNMNRIDIIAARGDGNFQKIVGEESLTTPSAPILPAGSLLVTSINITGNQIIDVQQPINGTEFVKKQYEGSYHVMQGGSIALDFNLNGANKYMIWNATEIKGWNWLLSNGSASSTAHYWGGKSFFITNNTVAPIRLKHSDIMHVGMMFSSGEDMLLPAGATAEFYASLPEMKYVGVEFKEVQTPTLQSVTEAGHTTNHQIIAQNDEETRKAVIGQYEMSIYNYDSDESTAFTSNQISISKAGKSAFIRQNTNQSGFVAVHQLPATSGTLAKLTDIGNNINFHVNQATATLSLVDSAGATLSSVNLAFLNNEATKFEYDPNNDSLKLINDEGEILSEVPVSAFVSNFANSLSLTDGTLSLRDNANTVLSAVNLELDNVNGLEDALALKGNDSNMFFTQFTGVSMFDNDNLNIRSGVYVGASFSNVPESTIAALTVKRYSPDWITQEYDVIDGRNLSWKRARYDGNTWSPWILTSSSSNNEVITGQKTFQGTGVNQGRTGIQINNTLGQKFALKAGIKNQDEIGFSIEDVTNDTTPFVYRLGNFGLGTTVPNEKLHVGGNGRIDGSLSVSGTVTAQNATASNHAVTLSQLQSSTSSTKQHSSLIVNGGVTTNIYASSWIANNPDLWIYINPNQAHTVTLPPKNVWQGKKINVVFVTDDGTFFPIIVKAASGDLINAGDTEVEILNHHTPYTFVALPTKVVFMRNV